MRTSITKSHQMYNLLASTTRKISAATYHKYKPRTVKLQGHIHFQQSCCEKCQNFENANAEASKYLRSVPRNIGDCIDQTLCPYTRFFPKITCILCNCDNCGIAKFKSVILASNQDKITDTRKRFLVKVWITKTERKSGKVASFVHWKFERCNYLGLIDLLLNQASSMAEHSFMASRNYWQYKLAKRNIIEGDIILVHDFAQNYLCKHQREIQGLHWHHKQVTIMPTVAHYICATCKGMVTHEIVHVSDDMRHNGHLVKAFTERSEKVLKQNKVLICKIIEFMDQAPSQYKNKTAFNYLSKRTTPVLKNFFGMRHGKSECDACTGRVKQGVTRLVQTEVEVINSAKSFYNACVKNLQKPLLHKCQHHILTFEFHNKLKSRPNTEKWPAIPETRKFHSIGNTQNGDVYLCTFSCCCKGCLHGNESCSNDVHPDKWRGYSLSGRKHCKPNRSWWCKTADDQIRKMGENTHLPSEINWQNRIAVLSAINSFEELVTFVNNNPLPCFTDDINDTITQQEIHNLDIVALHYIPDNAPQRIAPLVSKGMATAFLEHLATCCVNHKVDIWR